MEIKVKLSNLRVAPRKARKVINLVRGKKVSEAQSTLSFTLNRSAKPVLKLLNSAVATAKNDLHLNESDLYISKITVDEGTKLKRWHPMSRGRAFAIIKRSSHILLILSDGKQETAKKQEKPKTKVQKTDTKVKNPKVSKPKTKKVKKNHES